MRQVKISAVQYEMLVALGKRWRMKINDLIAELIEETTKAKQGVKLSKDIQFIFRFNYFSVHAKFLNIEQVIQPVVSPFNFCFRVSNVVSNQPYTNSIQKLMSYVS